MDDRYSVSPTPAPSEPPSWPSPPPGMKVKALRYYDFREYFGHDHRRLVSMEGNTPCINVRPTVRSKRIVEKLKELWRPKRPAYAFDATNDNNNDNHYKGNNDNNLGVKRFPRQHLFTQPHFDYGFSLKPAGIPWNNYHRNPHYWQQRRLPDCYRPSYPAASPRSDSDVDPSSGSPIYDSSHDDSSSSSPSTPLPPHPYYDREYRFAEYEEEQDEFYCERCELSFASRDSADNHMDEEDHWAPRYGCEMCERKYMSLEAANKHMDTLKHRVPRYSCETCPKQYATRKAAQDHMDLSDHWKPVIRCEPCGIDFSSENALKSVRKHFSSHLPKDSIVLDYMVIDAVWGGRIGFKFMLHIQPLFAFANKLIILFSSSPFSPSFPPFISPSFLIINSIMNPTYTGATRFAASSVEGDLSPPRD